MSLKTSSIVSSLKILRGKTIATMRAYQTPRAAVFSLAASCSLSAVQHVVVFSSVIVAELVASSIPSPSLVFSATAASLANQSSREGERSKLRLTNVIHERCVTCSLLVMSAEAAFAMLEERWADLDPGTQDGGKDLYEAAKASHRTLVDVFK